MTTDPRQLEGADPHTGEREIDPITGYDTTGHVWGSIRELNTPFPKIALWALLLAVAYSVVAWILLPAWPLGDRATRGVLGLTQGGVAEAKLAAIEQRRAAWMDRFAKPDFAALSQDKALLAKAMPAAHRLFEDNCAACHGTGGGGGPGFPVLNDTYWLWGGDPETIAETVTVGINAENDDTRYAQMPSFDYLKASERQALATYVAALPTGKADQTGAAAQLFADNCASCHGENGQGGLMNGAPSLTDDSVIYGQDVPTVLQTLLHGRQGEMPSWSDRLSEKEINLLALYVSRLSQDDEERTE